MNYYLDAMRHYADFSGRATRSQYWLFSLVLFGILFVTLLFDQLIDDTQAEGTALITGLVYLAHIIPSIAICVRRLHDIDKSGWCLLLLFVPLVGSIIVLIFMCTPSTPGANRFGVPVAQPQQAKKPLHNNLGWNGSLHNLEKLASLRASGAIDEDEYKQLKANILAQPAQ